MSNLVVSQTANLAKSLAITGDSSELAQVLKATAFKGQVSDAQILACYSHQSFYVAFVQMANV